MIPNKDLKEILCLLKLTREFLLNIREYSKSTIIENFSIRTTITSVHSRLWLAICRRDIDIQVIADLELHKAQSLAVVGSSLS